MKNMERHADTSTSCINSDLHFMIRIYQKGKFYTEMLELVTEEHKSARVQGDVF